MSVDQKCDEIFKAIDQDGSDSIDINEFTGYFEQFKSIVNVEGDAAATFGIIDTNADKSLSKDELKAYISARLKK